jgi:hypothetical protein
VLAMDWENSGGTGLGMGFAAPLPFRLIAQHEWFQAALGNNLAMPSRNSLRDAANAKGTRRRPAQLEPFGNKLAWPPVGTGSAPPFGDFSAFLNGLRSGMC